MNTKDLKQIAEHYASQQEEMRPKIAKLLGIPEVSPRDPRDLSGLDLGIGTPGENSDIRPIGKKRESLPPLKRKSAS